MGATTVRPAMSPARFPRSTCFLAVSDIPAILIKNSCLEILMSPRNGGRLPQAFMRAIERMERQHYSSTVTVIDNSNFHKATEVSLSATFDQVPFYLFGSACPGKGAAVRRGMLTSRAAARAGTLEPAVRASRLASDPGPARVVCSRSAPAHPCSSPPGSRSIPGWSSSAASPFAPDWSSASSGRSYWTYSCSLQSLSAAATSLMRP